MTDLAELEKLLPPHKRETLAKQRVLDAMYADPAANQEFLLRIHLGLNPIHSLLEAVRVLHDEGREAFEKLRGPRCEYAHEWRPRSAIRAIKDHPREE